MEKFQTGAVRDTGGKGRMDLLPMCALLRISKHMENTVAPDPRTGVAHYPERDWEKGLPMHTMIDSAMRHLAKYMDGRTDEDHLCAAATNLLMALWTEEKHPEMQDIPSRSQRRVFLGTSDTEEPLAPVPNLKAKEGATENLVGVCQYFDSVPEPRCRATKDHDRCFCGGDRANCSEYPPSCIIATVPRKNEGGPVAKP